MNTQDEMARNIAVADDVYEMRSKEKRDGESFSDVIRRLARRRRSILEFAGAWADIPDEEFREMEAAWAWANQPLEEALRRGRKRVEGPSHADSLPVDRRPAIRAAEISGELRRRGQTVGIMDLLIAAGALALGAEALVTRDASGFRHVGGLRV